MVKQKRGLASSISFSQTFQSKNIINEKQRENENSHRNKKLIKLLFNNKEVNKYSIYFSKKEKRREESQRIARKIRIPW